MYALDGRHVATLIDRQVLEGRHDVIWNGRDDLGRQLPSGSYFYRLDAGLFSDVRRMTLIR